MIVMRVNSKQLRTYLYSLDRMKAAYTEESKTMTQNCSREYRMLLIQNIMSEKYSGMYRPLSERYVEWKENAGAESGFWKLWGSTVNSISIRQTPKGYTVGIEKTAMPVRTSSIGRKKKLTPVWMYTYWGEFGRQAGGMFPKGQPPRPIFRLSAEEYRLKFLEKRRNDTLDRIARVW